MPHRNSDGTIRNNNAPRQLKLRTVIARWLEAETIRRKQMGLSFEMIAGQIERVARGQEQPLVPFSPGQEFPPGYTVTSRSLNRAFTRAMARMPRLAAEDMRALDTERCEDIYRGLAPGIMRGDPPSGSTAIKALEHKAKLNGYLLEDAPASNVGLSIHLHLGETR